MGGGTSSPLLQASSQISTNFQCNNCHVTLDQVSWIQCNKCQSFDLCRQCAVDYQKLMPVVVQKHEEDHQRMGLSESINNDHDLALISIAEAEGWAERDLEARIESEFQCIVNQKKIGNDYEMSIVMDMLKKKPDLALTTITTPDEVHPSDINTMIAGYHTQAYQTDIHLLSLDGGGIRGYMPIEVLTELIREKYLGDIENFDRNNIEHKKRFGEIQSKFIDQFDYIAGTSTELKQIYEQSSHFFKRNTFGPYLWDKYDPIRIHEKIDEIINTIQLPNGKQLTAEDATLLDIHNLLNPTDFITEEMLSEEKFGETFMSHENWLEFFDPLSSKDFHRANQSKIRSYIPREKVLLITSYNTTADLMTVFNTSYAKHWPYRIADVLKATMAAPTYFPAQHIHKRILHNGRFVKDPQSDSSPGEIFIDGGVFANDPELVALWAIRMQWKKLLNYHLLSIGTGCYNAKLNPSTWGGYPGWIRTDGLAINILMDATRSSTEVIANNLAKFNNIRRMKFNYRILESMSLDDPHFIERFNQEWITLKHADDFKALIYFYSKYIERKKPKLEHK